MTYTINRMIAGASIDARTQKALAGHGFGVLTKVNVKATMNTKPGVEMPGHHPPGACNPRMAYQTIGLGPRVGTMRPRNVVILRGIEGGKGQNKAAVTTTEWLAPLTASGRRLH